MSRSYKDSYRSNKVTPVEQLEALEVKREKLQAQLERTLQGVSQVSLDEVKAYLDVNDNEVVSTFFPRISKQVQRIERELSKVSMQENFILRSMKRANVQAGYYALAHAIVGGK